MNEYDKGELKMVVIISVFITLLGLGFIAGCFLIVKYLQ